MTNLKDVVAANEQDLRLFRAEYEAKMAELRKELNDRASRFFRDASAFLFQENPDLESFGWRQYTPYFNDGDECLFGAEVEEPDINGVDGWDLWDGVEEEEFQKLLPLKEKVVDFLSVFGEDDLEMMFGDHARITAFRDGTVEIDGYEHE